MWLKLEPLPGAGPAGQSVEVLLRCSLTQKM
jgi:hypothetical protein